MEFFIRLWPTLIWGAIFLVVTHIYAWSSMRHIRFLHWLKNSLNKIGDSVLLRCDDKRVVIIDDDKKEYAFYTGLIVWQSGMQRSVRDVKQIVEDQHTLRLLVWCLVAIPTFFITIYWGLYHDQNAFAGTIMVVVEQFYPFYVGPDMFEAVKNNLK